MTTVSSVGTGATNITTVGTITTGVFSGTTIVVAKGGTGATSFSAYGPVFGGTSSTNPLQSISSGNGVIGYSLGCTSQSTLPQFVYATGHNMLINGGMDIWQRLTSGTLGAASVAVAASTTAYTVDRWQLKTNASQACTVSQQPQSPGLGFNNANGFYAQVQRNHSQTGTGTIRFCQSIPLDQLFVANAGNANINLSFTIFAGADYSAASSHLVVNLYGGTGANKSGINGGFTGSSVLLTNTITLGGSPALFSTLPTTQLWNIAIPSNVTQLAVEFAYTPVGTAGVNDWFGVTEVQLEGAQFSTPFEKLPFSAVLNLCKRFYQKSFPYTTPPAQASATYVGAVGYTAQIASTTDGYSMNVYLPVDMLAATVPTFYSPTSANATWYNITGTADSGTAAATYYGANNFLINNPQVTGDAAGNLIAVHWSIDADLT